MTAGPTKRSGERQSLPTRRITAAGTSGTASLYTLDGEPAGGDAAHFRLIEEAIRRLDVPAHCVPARVIVAPGFGATVFPASNSLAVGSALLDKVPAWQLDAVLMHELKHVSDRPRKLAIDAVFAVSMLAVAVASTVVAQAFMVGVPGAILAYRAAMRHLERRADRFAAENGRAGPLADFLEQIPQYESTAAAKRGPSRLVIAVTGGGDGGLLAEHPAIATRVKTLRRTAAQQQAL